MMKVLQEVAESQGSFEFVELACINEMVDAFQAHLSIHIFVRRVVISFYDKNDSLSLSLAELKDKRALHIVKKRRNVFSWAVGSAGKSRGKEEQCDVSIMRDELWRLTS